jgi:hypothetical protein
VACGLLLGAVAVTVIVWSLASSEERRISYTVRGAPSGVALDLDDADVEVAGGGRTTTVVVSHVDRFGFGHGPVADRSIAADTFRVRSRCPATILHGCSVRYRVVVPDNVPLVIRTTSGSVHLRGYRGSARITTARGDIDIAGFCGFSLQARAESGDIDAAAACAPQQLVLRSTDGHVHVAVPPGRYQVEAESTNGGERVSGVSAVADAPFSIQALSSSGDVVVEGRR